MPTPNPVDRQRRSGAGRKRIHPEDAPRFSMIAIPSDHDGVLRYSKDKGIPVSEAYRRLSRIGLVAEGYIGGDAT